MHLEEINTSYFIHAVLPPSLSLSLSPPSRWVVDLGGDFNIVKIRITNTFEWVLAKSWGVVFMDPYSVTLLDSGGTQVASRRFTDARTFYLWEDVYVRARYVRLDSLEYDGPRSVPIFMREGDIRCPALLSQLSYECCTIHGKHYDTYLLHIVL